MDFIQRADAFAAKAHAGQKRKYNGQPYIEHPRRVAAVVGMYTKAPEVIAAALLHDTVEDCDVTIADIAMEFGAATSVLVGWLTDPEHERDGSKILANGWNRKARKAFVCGKLSCAPYWAQSIKCCDLIDNTSDIVHYDKSFAVVYLIEKRMLLGSMTHCHPDLQALAFAQLDGAEASLVHG